MEPVAAGAVVAVVILALFGLGIVGFVVWDRKKDAQKKATGSNFDDSAGSEQLDAGRSTRWMTIGWFIFVFALGLLIGMLML